MFSRNNLLLLPALLTVGLFAFSQTTLAEEALVPALSDVDSDPDDADDDESDRSQRHKRSSASPSAAVVRAAESVTANGTLRANLDSEFTFAPVAETSESERVVVRGFFIDPPDYPALPEVEGTRINSGKKTSFVKPEEFPTIDNNNYREALATTPGLLVSEEPSSPIINFGYRGLDSQRAETMQVLKDGISLKNEQFGFPETHYTPILDAVERIEFVRAGAALQFGPQPGGALNFIMKMPRKDAPFHFLTKNSYGTDELFTSYTAIDGTVGQFGYYAYYDHREREGFRTNSDYDLDNGSVRLVFDATNDSRFILTLDLTRRSTANQVDCGAGEIRTAIRQTRSFTMSTVTRRRAFLIAFVSSVTTRRWNTRRSSRSRRNWISKLSADIFPATASANAEAVSARSQLEAPPARTRFNCAKPGPRARKRACAMTTTWRETLPPLRAACISTTPNRTAPMSVVSRRERAVAIFAT